MAIIRNSFMFGGESQSQLGITFEEKIGHERVMFLDKLFISILDHTDGAERVVGPYDTSHPNGPLAQMALWSVMEAMKEEGLTIDEASYLLWNWYEAMHDR